MDFRNLFSFGSRRSVTLDPVLTGAEAGAQRGDGPDKGGSFLARVTRADSEESALTVAAVFRAAELRASAIAGLRLDYQVWDAVGRCFRSDVSDEGRRLNFLLNVRPNARMSAFQMWKRVELMRIFEGHCCIYPVLDTVTGEVKELVPCRCSWDVYRNRYSLIAPEFGLNGKTVGADEVIVVRGVVTRNHPEGVSVIHYAARTMAVNATSESLSLESAAKGGRQKLIIQQKDDGSGSALLGPANDDEMERNARRLQNSLQRDDVIYDPTCGEITTINYSMADMQLLETRKFTVSDVARFFGVPRSLLMDDSNSNYNTAEAASLEFMTRTLSPMMREMEDELDGKLLAPSEFGLRRFRYDSSGLFALDVNAQTNRNKSMLETGVASVNELRAQYNLPAIAGGDEHYVSCNVAPVGSAKLSGGVPESN